MWLIQGLPECPSLFVGLVTAACQQGRLGRDTSSSSESRRGCKEGGLDPATVVVRRTRIFHNVKKNYWVVLHNACFERKDFLGPIEIFNPYHHVILLSNQSGSFSQNPKHDIKYLMPLFLYHYGNQ